ncbi:MAG: OmpA family protein [Planctomycetota bacterium]
MFQRMHTRLTLIAGAAAALGGCAGVPQDEYDLAVQENTQLRERLAQAQNALERAETDKRVLNERVADRDTELSRLRGEVVNAQTEAAVRRRTGGTDADGFESRGDARVVTIAGDLLFASGQATVRKAGRAELDRIAGVLNDRFSDNLIRVEGHTDSDPIKKSAWKTNERLSSERALAVEAYLVSKGVDAARIYSAAMGSSRPKADKQTSRRVEIVVLETEATSG